MKYKHLLYASAIVRAGSKRAQFSDYELETTDDELKAALDANENVERAGQSRPGRKKEDEEE